MGKKREEEREREGGRWRERERGREGREGRRREWGEGKERQRKGGKKFNRDMDAHNKVDSSKALNDS